MLEKIISLDKSVFIFLNGLGSEKFDTLWLFLTNQAACIPFFAFIWWLIKKKIGTKQAFYLLLTILVLVLFTDQTCNLVKNSVQRLRPCNTEDLKSIIRIVKCSDTYSFFSGHATNSTAVSLFIFLLFRKDYKYLWLIFIWPVIFGFSRIYLGMHFPSDILVGYVYGAICGVVAYSISKYLYLKKLIFK